MKTQTPAPALSGHLCVSNYNDIQHLDAYYEFPFSGNSVDLWKLAAVKFQEYYAMGWTPAIYFKNHKQHISLQISAEDIDMIMAL